MPATATLNQLSQATLRKFQREEPLTEAKNRKRPSKTISRIGKALSTTGAAASDGTNTPVQTTKQRKAFMQFIEALIFATGFLFLLWLHEDITRVHELEKVMQTIPSRQFGPHSQTLRDVQQITGIWDWVEGALLPAVVQHKDAVFDFFKFASKLFLNENFD